jgi:hypothetical protein
MVGLATVGTLVLSAAPALASKPGFVFPEGCCFYKGETVRTVVPPSAFPREGTDDFYAIVDGAGGQKPVVAEAPGDVGYNGGHWAFHLVEWTVSPYLLTSASAVLAAEGAGHVTITRIPANDFLCPIQL